MIEGVNPFTGEVERHHSKCQMGQLMKTLGTGREVGSTAPRRPARHEGQSSMYSGDSQTNFTSNWDAVFGDKKPNRG